MPVWGAEGEMHVMIIIILVLFIGLFVVLSVPLEADSLAPDDQQPDIE